ncbi:MAG: hypothetical protein A2X61_07115 [Ignavibacteria bacterium GWB2_35_12]|nr:MAG: hypothetical protein A2X63_06205 [Ignavibacteria bacterium GWA2_35_8]OGU39247.1 MAG: hypothetical protein A2X61_07115 [Ignavibacteria bacterium GWB2_35_12]OGU88680.1 MAG: hypothetical protein A2220_00495 [Ignavibacteria bacterium RIFOXYA2_FULL_35_10]OGV23252.1 MAG: hypothetical protein A2475_13440 [Ignavibacteria bacterium RIFOXYC2_FULL_35_21]
MKLSAFFLLFLFCFTSYSRIIQVGQNKQYTLPSQGLSAAQDGDTVEIDAGIYTGDVCTWNKNNLLVRGVGGYAHLAAGGKNAGGKAIWVVTGNNNVIEYIEFSDCTVPDSNGAGIRFEGTNLTIRHCNFHDNEDGILTSANDSSDIVIESSEFARNGYGDGYSHNLYIGHVRSLTFRFNYSHHAKIGHNLKSRASTNYILYNRIMDEETGNSSMLIDLPNGGKSYIIGNLLMQGPLAENRKLISYGADDLTNPDSVLYVVNNTMVNKRTAGATFVYIQKGTKEARIINNIFTGPGEVLLGSADTVTNIHFEDVEQAYFADEANYDYRIFFRSPAFDAGTALGSVAGFSLVPEYEYIHPMSYTLRLIYDYIDIGAYEAPPLGVEDDLSLLSLSVYPNPCTDEASISFNLEMEQNINLNILDLLGDVCYSLNTGVLNEGMNKININYDVFVKMQTGTYFLTLSSTYFTLTEILKVVK